MIRQGRRALTLVKHTPDLLGEQLLAAGMIFYPLASKLGSDLPGANPQIRTVTCPYTGAQVSVVPPLNPDASLIHVHQQYPIPDTWARC